MTDPVPRILLIDSYDSFTHNLAHLIRRNVPSCQIYLIRNDDVTYGSLLLLLPSFSAIFVGPGPGSPANDTDVGIVKNLWSLPESHLLPIFGVCLGFQSLVLAFGGSLRMMQVVKHGMISRVEHSGQDLFKGAADDVEATRYHSLCVDLVSQESKAQIKTLAWACDGEENGRVLMAARHRAKPFWGVQYHPESVCTRGGGGEVIRNFWRLAVEWTTASGRKVLPLPNSATELVGDAWPHLQLTRALPCVEEALSVESVTLELPGLSVTRVCELIGVNSSGTNFVMLDSAAKPGRFTIMGALLPSALSIRYTHPEAYITLQHGAAEPCREPVPAGSTIWDWLGGFMSSRTVRDPGREDVPFWGGLVGYLSYELGVAELGVPLKYRVVGEKRNSDVNLVFVERSVVIDGETGRVHVQSLIPGDEPWLQDMAYHLKASCLTGHPAQMTKASPLHSRLTSPSRQAYIPQVSECKHHLSVGSSYELCLTAPSTLHIPTSPYRSSWDLYTLLRASNPAPHAAFLRMGPTTLLCSSPERFLKWDRAGRCELRPIKGTLRKTVVDKCGKRRKMRREDADELLGRNVKERAENLMIVDLVRHDLGGVVEAADGVEVKQLMGVEEYETVWQMVSVIAGTVPAAGGGWEVLRRSLPPGSMTGAPKKRSVELLQDIEGQERGVYSGVCGYWCVGGGGDWAVIIRSCFRYDDGENIHLNENPDVHFNGNGPVHHSGNGRVHPSGDGDSYLNGSNDPHLSGDYNSHLSSDDSRLNGDNSRLNGDNSRLNGDNYRLNGDNSRLNGDNSRLNGDRDLRLHLDNDFCFNGSDGSHLNGGTHYQDWTLGAGGAITALSDPVSEWEEMRVKLGSVGRAFGVDEL